MKDVLDPLYSAGFVEAPDGARHATVNGIDAGEVEFIRELISADGEVRQTIEIGCALGFSSCAICSATAGRPGARNVIVDPLQFTKWSGVGVALLDRLGIRGFELIEEGSEFALPRLASEAPESFDLAFIDGFHTFDHTMIDLFFCDLLVKVGGYIVIDDCTWRTVSQAVRHYAAQPRYVVHAKRREAPLRRLSRIARLKRYPSMIALRKVSREKRLPWS